jgi:DNA-binding GntR family transcriptional regulator
MSVTMRTKPSKVSVLKRQHGTSVLTALKQVRELIVPGKLSPGTWIVEEELANSPEGTAETSPG